MRRRTLLSRALLAIGSLPLLGFGRKDSPEIIEGELKEKETEEFHLEDYVWIVSGRTYSDNRWAVGRLLLEENAVVFGQVVYKQTVQREELLKEGLKKGGFGIMYHVWDESSDKLYWAYGGEYLDRDFSPPFKTEQEAEDYLLKLK